MAIVSAGLGKYVSKGVNDSNSFTIFFYLTAQAVASDTIHCLIPDHTDKDAVPTSAVGFERAVTGVATRRDLAITSHQLAPNDGQNAPLPVGTTVLTAAATLPIGSIIEIKYSAVKFTAP